MDVKKPDIKAILAKLSFLRNHMNMLVPIIIAIVAIVPLVLAGVVGRRNMVTSKESVAMSTQLKRFATEAPSERQWELERDYQRQYLEDANQIEAYARQSSLRPLLSTKVFPNPKDASQLIFTEFRDRYLAGVETMIVAVNGRDCPSPDELGTAAGAGGAQGMMSGYGMEGTEGMEGYGMGGYGMGGMGNNSKIIDAICVQRAQSSTVYVNHEDIAGVRFWNAWEFVNKDFAVEDCWYWQLGYWIVSDIFATVEKCNHGSASVFYSPVKRIQNVSFARIQSMGGMGMEGMGYAGGYDSMMMGGVMGRSSEEVLPFLVIDEKKDVMVKSHTRRITDETNLVMHFNLKVVVEASKALWFMKQLCSGKEHTFKGFDGKQAPQTFQHNQITILESNARLIQPERGLHMLYRYGPAPVVEMDLTCEYLFDRAALQDIMPEVVLTKINGTEEGV